MTLAVAEALNPNKPTTLPHSLIHSLIVAEALSPNKPKQLTHSQTLIQDLNKQVRKC